MRNLMVNIVLPIFYCILNVLSMIPLCCHTGNPPFAIMSNKRIKKQLSTIFFYNFFLIRLNSWGFSLYYYIISCKLLVYNHAGDYSGKIDLIKTTQWRCQTTKYYLPHGSIQCPLDSFYWILGRFHVWQIQNRSFPPIFLLSYPFPPPILFILQNGWSCTYSNNKTGYNLCLYKYLRNLSILQYCKW